MSTLDGAAVLDEYLQTRSVSARGVGQEQLESEAPITTYEFQYNQCECSLQFTAVYQLLHTCTVLWLIRKRNYQTHLCVHVYKTFLPLSVYLTTENDKIHTLESHRGFHLCNGPRRWKAAYIR